MSRRSGPKPPSYNVQTAVDADTGLIIHHDVTVEPSDNRLLHPMSMATKEMLGQEHLTVVCAAEHPFGSIKRMMAGGRFLTRNLKGTRTEMALSVIAYNMLRASNIQAATA